MIAESMHPVPEVLADTGDDPSVTNLTRQATFADLSLHVLLQSAITVVLLFVRIGWCAVSCFLSLHASALKRMFYGMWVSMLDKLKLLIKDQKSAFIWFSNHDIGETHSTCTSQTFVNCLVGFCGN